MMIGSRLAVSVSQCPARIMAGHIVVMAMGASVADSSPEPPRRGTHERAATRGRGVRYEPKPDSLLATLRATVAASPGGGAVLRWNLKRSDPPSVLTGCNALLGMVNRFAAIRRPIKVIVTHCLVELNSSSGRAPRLWYGGTARRGSPSSGHALALQ